MINGKLLLSILALVILFLTFQSSVYAQSNYVLPYPSAMPGSIFYKLNLVKEQILKYWYFGDFGQFHYNLKQSDKYLVEAKTLFEYKQYLLGLQALKRSDKYFSNTLPYIIKAQKEGKNIVQKQNLLKEAGLKHINVINSIKEEIPEIFIWRPENSLSSRLDLKNAVQRSISIRKKYL